MTISPYYIQNVIRVYGKQLSQAKNNSCDQKSNLGAYPEDKITISDEAKRKFIMESVSKDIVERITQFGPREDIKEYEEYGSSLRLKKYQGKDNSKLVFKTIDPEKGETIIEEM